MNASNNGVSHSKSNKFLKRTSGGQIMKVYILVSISNIQNLVSNFDIIYHITLMII